MSPALSKAQRQATAIALKVKSGETKAKPRSPSTEMARSMTKKQLREFSKTKEKGLPAHVKKK